MKLTKMQHKNRSRVFAWLKGVEFQENARARLVIPQLSVDEVLESYVPLKIKDFGQYFTPLEMAKQAVVNEPIAPGSKILEPSAGIGHLVKTVLEEAQDAEITAYEIDSECCEIGQKLFPDVSWHHISPFVHMDTKLRQQFDYVVMNPPFGLTAGMGDAKDRAKGMFKRSEHLFLELALKALKPGGKIIAIAPVTFLETLPRDGAAFFGNNACLTGTAFLDGTFAFTRVNISAFYIEGRMEAYEPVQVEPLVDEVMTPQEVIKVLKEKAVSVTVSGGRESKNIDLSKDLVQLTLFPM